MQPGYKEKLCTKESIQKRVLSWKKWFYALTPEEKVVISQHMRESNRYRTNPELRAQLSAKLRAMGHKPPVQGGNGRGLTVPQEMLLNALGEDWVAEYIVPLGKNQSGYPTHYKLDLAYLDCKLNIEVDGHSHDTLKRREQDQRKDTKLEELGWTVLRFSNRMILESLDTVVQMVCSTCGTLKLRGQDASM
jgi:hypothetical protein